MKSIRHAVLLFIALTFAPLFANAHPGHGDDGFFRSNSPAHLLLHPWQLATVIVVGFALTALARSTWVRCAGGLLALLATAMLMAGGL